MLPPQRRAWPTSSPTSSAVSRRLTGCCPPVLSAGTEVPAPQSGEFRRTAGDYSSPAFFRDRGARAAAVFAPVDLRTAGRPAVVFLTDRRGRVARAGALSWGGGNSRPAAGSCSPSTVTPSRTSGGA